MNVSDHSPQVILDKLYGKSCDLFVFFAAAGQEDNEWPVRVKPLRALDEPPRSFQELTGSALDLQRGCLRTALETASVSHYPQRVQLTRLLGR